jgi:diadenylate cyclase
MWINVLFLFSIGFLEIRFWDILDIVIVGFLIYHIYKLLKGNIAFNIFIGLLLLYVVYWLVKELRMNMLTAVLDQFVSIGVIIIVIIFQPEIRRFLLFLGNTTLKQRSNFFKKLMDKSDVENEKTKLEINTIIRAINWLSKRKIGAIVVLTRTRELDGITNPGVILNAEIKAELLESIFNKNSPLHDGAVIICDGLIYSASAVLPLSENTELPPSAGLRHRAALGLTERTHSAAIVVSEETGNISFSAGGKLNTDIKPEFLQQLLLQHLN